MRLTQPPKLLTGSLSDRQRSQDGTLAAGRTPRNIAAFAVAIAIAVLIAVPTSYVLMLRHTISKLRYQLLHETDHKAVAEACYALLTNSTAIESSCTYISWDDPSLVPVLSSVVKPLWVAIAHEEKEIWLYKTCGHSHIGLAFCRNEKEPNRYDLVYRRLDVHASSEDDVVLYSLWEDRNAEPQRRLEPSSAGAPEGRSR